MLRRRGFSKLAAGQSLVEFTISATLLLLLVFGVIQLAVIGGAALAVTQYGYAGVRYGSINATTCSGGPPCSCSWLATQIQNNVPPSSFIDDSGLAAPTVTGASCPSSVGSGSTITVNISYNLSTGNKLFLPAMFGITLPTTLTNSESILVQ
jgi:TadE-like protein